jgi:hypothetical protein
MKRRPATGEIKFTPQPLRRRNSGYTAARKFTQCASSASPAPTSVHRAIQRRVECPSLADEPIVPLILDGTVALFCSFTKSPSNAFITRCTRVETR